MYEILYEVRSEQSVVQRVEEASGDFQVPVRRKQRSNNMSTLTSMVKSGKRTIIKTKTEQPLERERKSIKAQQKLPESERDSTSKRGVLGRPDPGVSRGVLGRPDPGVSQDATRPQ
jgi:hypothetical protein